MKQKIKKLADQIKILAEEISKLTDQVEEVYSVKRYAVVLDAGHGGLDPSGAYTTAPSKMYKHKTFTFYEGVFNRIIVGKLKDVLIENDIPVFVVSDSYKDIPLKFRVEAANRIHSKFEGRSIFLSIHGNAASNPSAKGLEVFTSPGQTESDILAEFLVDAFEQHLPERNIRTDTRDKDKDKEARFYVLVNTAAPAVLSENGFFTNPEEADSMLSEEYQNRIVAAHLQAIKKYLKVKRPLYLRD